MVKNYFLIAFVVFTLAACAAGHADFVDTRSDWIGTKMQREQPYKWEDSGQFIRGDYVVSGQGLTAITENEDGDIVYHYSVHEILANSRTEKEWVGKCLVYYVVNPKTFIVKDWGFDEGGNPLSCRTFV
jgi:hypothetical protein